MKTIERPSPAVSLKDIRAAAHRIAGGTSITPCTESASLSEITGTRVYCKFENLQRTGSFKERGARNALLQLTEKQKKIGVIAASAGNHALGLAYHGGLLAIPVTVVMPTYAPLIKITRCETLGARVILRGRDFAEARAVADEIAAHEGRRYIHGFDDPAIIAGQGTVGLEILRQLPTVDAIVCPIGGAGLISGLTIAVKGLRPDVQIIGVESHATASFSASLRAGKPVAIPRASTLADGLAVLKVGAMAFALARPHVDKVVRVTEQSIAVAILRLLELEKTVVEGAGAAPLAALLVGGLPELRGKRVVLVLSGGNIDPATLGRVIEKGLVQEGRLAQFTTLISDRPGGLAALTQAIAASGASIRDITHDRAFSGPDVNAVRAICTVETRNRAHLAELRRTLRKLGVLAK